MKTIQSIDKAMTVLEIIANHNGELVLTTIGRELNMPLPTLHGFITSLEKWDLVRKDSITGRYSIGNKIFQLSCCCTGEQWIIQICHPILKVLSERFDETVHLAIPDKTDILYLDKVECRHPFRMTSLVGTRENYLKSAIGMVIAGNKTDYQPSEQEKELLAKHLHGTSAVLFHDDIDLNCFAEVLFNRRHEVVAGISLAIPRCRYKETMYQQVIDQLGQAARQLQPFL